MLSCQSIWFRINQNKLLFVCECGLVSTHNRQTDCFVGKDHTAEWQPLRLTAERLEDGIHAVPLHATFYTHLCQNTRHIVVNCTVLVKLQETADVIKMTRWGSGWSSCHGSSGCDNTAWPCVTGVLLRKQHFALETTKSNMKSWLHLTKLWKL